MSEELGGLPTEGRLAETEGFDSLTALGMVEAMHRADGAAVAAVGRALPEVAAVVEAAAERMRAGGRMVYVGAGTSGRLGVLDASECGPTFGVSAEKVQGVIAGGDRALRLAVEGAEDDFAAGEAAVRGFGAGDVVVGIATSGRTPFVLGALRAAREAGALTVGVSCVPGSAVALAGEMAVTVETGAEVVTGSTRLKAGTATKLVLNMISTGVMARLGYVYGNWMVNVQGTNGKLRDRAVRMVEGICGVGRVEAERVLAEAGGEVKVAVVMVRLGVGVGVARWRLGKAGGVLRKVLEG